MSEILSKTYELKSIQEKMQRPWRTLRELTSKNRAKQIVGASDDQILKWLSLVPGVELLKDLGAYDAFCEAFCDLEDVDDIAEMLEKFLIIYMKNPFKVNSRIFPLKGKLEPFELYIPKTSREVFFLGLFMENCLKDLDQIEEYKNDKFLAALTYRGVPYIACKFEIEGQMLSCTEALKRQNDNLLPFENYQVLELEKMIAKKLKLAIYSDYKENQDLIDEKIEESLNGGRRRRRRNSASSRTAILKHLEREIKGEKEVPQDNPEGLDEVSNDTLEKLKRARNLV